MLTSTRVCGDHLTLCLIEVRAVAVVVAVQQPVTECTANSTMCIV